MASNESSVAKKARTLPITLFCSLLLRLLAWAENKYNMGKAAKICRLNSHTKSKKLKAGKAFKDSAGYKIEKAIKREKKKAKKLSSKLQKIKTTPKYTEACGHQGTFKGVLVKKLEEKWQVKWEDGSVQDGIREAWFERVAPFINGHAHVKKDDLADL